MLEEQKELLEKKGFNVESFQKLSIQEREDILYALQEEHGGSDKPINHIVPLVSVCIPTYQHAEYIIQCLDGALMQKTTFPIEIIIGDDGSVDGTVETCKRYADKYPNKIRFFNEIRSLTRVFDLEGHIERSCNWWWTMKNARGKYIALCEGDDYWTDPLKLQKQVDFLEGHPGYGLCYTNVLPFYEISKTYGKCFGGNSEKLKDLLLNNTIPTLSVLVRATLVKEYFLEINPELRNWKMGDYPLWLYVASNSQIKYLSFTSGCYRILENSASHSNDLVKGLNFVKSSNQIALFFAEREGIRGSLSLILNSRISQINLQLSVLKNDEMSMRKARMQLLKSMALSIPLKLNIKTFLLILFPRKMTYYFKVKY